MYSKQWTNRETQSLAFAVLRKQLYPEYLVRWNDEGIILIYKPTVDTNNPILLLSLDIEASKDANEGGYEVLRPDTLPHPVLHIVGGKTCYKVAELVKPLLK